MGFPMIFSRKHVVISKIIDCHWLTSGFMLMKLLAFGASTFWKGDVAIKWIRVGKIVSKLVICRGKLVYNCNLCCMAQLVPHYKTKFATTKLMIYLFRVHLSHH